jgi:hypothetical protein
LAFPLQKHSRCEEIKNYREELKFNRERNVSFGAIRFRFGAIRFRLCAIKFRLGANRFRFGAIKYALYRKPSAVSAHFLQHAEQTFDSCYALYSETAASAMLSQAAGAEVLRSVCDYAADTSSAEGQRRPLKYFPQLLQSQY